MTAPVAQYSPEYLAEDIGSTIIAAASLMIIFCTLFVGLRYYARYLTSTAFGTEDVIIPFAWLAEIALCATGICKSDCTYNKRVCVNSKAVQVKRAGTGRHVAYNIQIDPTRIREHFKGVVTYEFVHPAAVALPKMCVVILYLRVFTKRLERNIAWGILGVIAAVWFSLEIAASLQCTPFAFSFDRSIPGGRCFDVFAFAYASSIPNIVTDVVVVFLPIRTVWELKISDGRKIGLMLIFLTGSV